MKYLGVVLRLKYADTTEYGVVIGENKQLNGYYTAWIKNCSKEQAIEILRIILFKVLREHPYGIINTADFKTKYVPVIYLDKFRGISVETEGLLEKLCKGQKDNSYLYITKVYPNVRI